MSFTSGPATTAGQWVTSPTSPFISWERSSTPGASDGTHGRWKEDAGSGSPHCFAPLRGGQGPASGLRRPLARIDRHHPASGGGVGSVGRQAHRCWHPAASPGRRQIGAPDLVSRVLTYSDYTPILLRAERGVVLCSRGADEAVQLWLLPAGGLDQLELPTGRTG